MVDKVKTAVLEREGLELDFQEEANPSSDYLSAKGVAFEGSNDFLIEKVGGVIKSTYAAYSYKPEFNEDDELVAYETFNGSTQTVGNRLAKNDLTYTGDKVTQESIKIYSLADGTTVLNTTTVTHTYTGDNLTKTEVSEA